MRADPENGRGAPCLGRRCAGAAWRLLGCVRWRWWRRRRRQRCRWRRRPPVAPSGDPIVASSSVQGQCAAPRVGIDPDTGAAFPDRPGSTPPRSAGCAPGSTRPTSGTTKCPPTLVAGDYATPARLLRRPEDAAVDAPRAGPRTASTSPTTPRNTAGLSQGGVAIGYGIELAFLSAAPPRDIRVAYTEPGSPAAQAAIDRGLEAGRDRRRRRGQRARTLAALNAGAVARRAPARRTASSCRPPDGSTAQRHADGGRGHPHAGAEREDHRTPTAGRSATCCSTTTTARPRRS